MSFHWSFGFQQSFILVLLTCFEIVQQVYSIKGPTVIKGYIGEDAVFMWNTTNQTRIFSASWGIRKGIHADPQFINVNTYTGKVNVNSDLDETIQSRVGFLGDLTKGRAWFVLRNLTVNDTNEYIASMSDDEATVLPYPVRLVVKQKREVYSIKGPTDIKSYIGGDAVFMWNTTNQRRIFSASWGIRKGNIADPRFIYVNGNAGKVNVNSDLDKTIQSRVAFIGNLMKGRAWFVLRNLTVNDSNVYIASISEDKKNELPYPVRLVVTQKNESPSKPPADPPADHPEDLSEGEIAGIVIGAISGVIIIAGIIYVVYKKNKNKHEKDIGFSVGRVFNEEGIATTRNKARKRPVSK